MKVRILAAVIAVVLAVVGAVALTNYVAGADQRALKGAESRQVYVVRAPIPAGTTADELGQFTAQQTLPANAVAAGAVTDLSQLTGKVPSTALVPGEQLLTSRFVDPASLKPEKPGVKVPAGMQEVTIQLEPQRVVGGQLVPGDTVGVVFSYNVKKDPLSQAVTHLKLHKVLVTSVQGLPTPTAAPTASAEPTTTGGGSAPNAPAVPAGAVLVTLARTAPDVEKIVWAAENGAIWLTKEPVTASETGTKELNVDGLFK
ncbi:Flp pilus assembly protein CpaB [Tersicoccus phoenicis]|uniref:Flp pilus assembly protein CpaB n=1 Tax=Tersicoccus phoenicis TaxID=554083 RepID=A0A1R1LJI9_9MICC|nr:RcpC/CpaB family pilus assembly protein [Tersicoccus phoenicis]OMH27715.1 Flp pilus assembly protein CpaB [Tersicoccus phoenicis]